MKIVIDKLPPGASVEEIIKAYNLTADKLNMTLENIDEENISEPIMKKINAKEGE